MNHLTLREVNGENSSIIFVGHGGMGSNALSLYRGFETFVKDLRFVDTKFLDSPPRPSYRWIVRRLFPKFYGLIASKWLERKIMKLVGEDEPDILIVFKGNYVSKIVLEKINSLKVHYHPDDSTNIVNRTKIFHEAEKHYDVHFTSKRHNIVEIFDRTKKDVYFIWYAFDHEWHLRNKPLDFHSPKFLLGFIGHMRPDRINLIDNLADNYRKNFAIAGLNWNRVPGLRRKITLFPPAYEREFSAFVADAPIQLGLLNSDNRDQHTARSFEIPAAGGLLIAEDTPDHREMFGPGENALFFTGSEDLREKLAWIHSHPSEVKTIAENGFRHITTNQNTWRDRSYEILSLLGLQVSSRDADS